MNRILDRNPARAARLRQHLWAESDDGVPLKIHALLDAARGRDVYEVVRFFPPEHHCLFRGDLTPAMRRAAPYLIDLKPDSEFTRDILEVGWGDAWGVFLYTPATTVFEDLRQHLRRLLQVRDEAGRKLFFRFYDPRILRVYLPTCRPDEVRTFCGPIVRLAMEATEPANLIRYDREDGALRRSFHLVG